MFEDNIDFAVAYYQAMNDKNISYIEKHIHPNIQFISPMITTTGKDAYLQAIKKFFSIFKSLTIRAKFGSHDQAMLVSDVDFPAPMGNVRTAVLMTIKDNLIIRIELFFDVKAITL